VEGRAREKGDLVREGGKKRYPFSCRGKGPLNALLLSGENKRRSHGPHKEFLWGKDTKRGGGGLSKKDGDAGYRIDRKRGKVLYHDLEKGLEDRSSRKGGGKSEKPTPIRGHFLRKEVPSPLKIKPRGYQGGKSPLEREGEV